MSAPIHPWFHAKTSALPADLQAAILATTLAMQRSRVAANAYEAATDDLRLDIPGAWNSVRQAYRAQRETAPVMSAANARQSAVMARYGIGDGWRVLPAVEQDLVA